MIHDNKISLPVCAFGAGLAHAAALTLILPIIITLPAPNADTAPRTVAIHVEIRTATAEPAMAEGDAEDMGAPLGDALGSEDITAALPAPVETEDLNGATEPAGPEDALVPEPGPDDDAQLGAVANVGTESMPAVVPVPLRKPPQSTAVEENKPARTAVAVPEKHVPVYRPRTRAPAKPKGFLGGRTATSMPEYPFSAAP